MILNVFLKAKFVPCNNYISIENKWHLVRLIHHNRVGENIMSLEYGIVNGNILLNKITILSCKYIHFQYAVCYR